MKETYFAATVERFQSTLPARGATCVRDGIADAGKHFNPRSPHGERLYPIGGEGAKVNISIHAPRTGSDADEMQEASRKLFQSTLPARGATSCSRRASAPPCYFNPRSPHGERPTRRALHAGIPQHFNPRSPHGERRYKWYRKHYSCSISIHAPRTGSD